MPNVMRMTTSVPMPATAMMNPASAPMPSSATSPMMVEKFATTTHTAMMKIVRRLSSQI